MLRNYIKSAIRALVKYKGTTGINILGLTIGLCSTILISVYVHNEISYDKFHENADRIVRIGAVGKMLGNDLDMAVTPSVMAGPLLEEYPEVENVTRILRNTGNMVSHEDVTFTDNILYVDSTFFDVFSYKLLQGDPKEVLTDPHSIVITPRTAKKFFGNENPIGKSLNVNSADNVYTVTGVVEEPPLNSHFHFNYLAELHSRPNLDDNNGWLSHNFYTYVLLKEGTNQEHFTSSLQTLLEKYVSPLLKQMLKRLERPSAKLRTHSFRKISTPLSSDVPISYFSETSCSH